MTTNWYELENLAHLEHLRALDDLRRPRPRIHRSWRRFGARRSTRLS